MNYREAVAAIRTQRDRDVLGIMRAAWAASAEVQSAARREIAQLQAERDAEIRRLRGKRLSVAAIAAEVGCSRALVQEVLSPNKRAAYNARRRAHWRKISHLSPVPRNGNDDGAIRDGDGARNPVAGRRIG